MPLCGDAVFGEEGPAQSPLESLAGPAEKGGGSIGRTTDEFSHVPRFQSVQMEGENETLVLVERIDGAMDTLHGLARLDLTISPAATGCKLDVRVNVLVTVPVTGFKGLERNAAFDDPLECVLLAVLGNPARPGLNLGLGRVELAAVFQGLEDGILKEVLQILGIQKVPSGFAVDFDTRSDCVENLLTGNGFTVGGGKSGISGRVDVLHSVRQD